MTDLLNRARAYEEAAGEKIAPAARPAYHLTPLAGWMNDPNGFSLYRGQYHLFYQYHPYDTHWGPMHWGHAVSDDLVRWRYLPCALAPDEEYDAAGCFSGSAVELDDGRQLLLYTGVRQVETPDGRREDRQTQCVALGDGVDYRKLPANPVLTAADLPDGSSPVDFRDPKIWREDGGFGCVVGSRAPDGSGALVLFRSADGIGWRRAGVLDRCENRYGKMWECPDFFPLDGWDVILTSPQEMRAEGLEFHDGNGTLCLIGHYDAAGGRFVRAAVQAIEYGIDFYAPQTLLTPDGRRVMIGWMQCWETSKDQPAGCPWFGQMTVVRELHVRAVGGVPRLIQTPVAALDALHGAPHHAAAVLGPAPRALPGVGGRQADLRLEITPEGDGYTALTLALACDAAHATTLTYDPGAGTLTLDRSRSGNPGTLDVRSCKVRDRGGRLSLRILLDRFSAEIFVNGGEQALSTVLYTPLSAQGITLAADGAARAEATCWGME